MLNQIYLKMWPSCTGAYHQERDNTSGNPDTDLRIIIPVVFDRHILQTNG